MNPEDEYGPLCPGHQVSLGRQGKPGTILQVIRKETGDIEGLQIRIEEDGTERLAVRSNEVDYYDGNLVVFQMLSSKVGVVLEYPMPKQFDEPRLRRNMICIHCGYAQYLHDEENDDHIFQ